MGPTLTWKGLLDSQLKFTVGYNPRPGLGLPFSEGGGCQLTNGKAEWKYDGFGRVQTVVFHSKFGTGGSIHFKVVNLCGTYTLLPAKVDAQFDFVAMEDIVRAIWSKIPAERKP